VVSLVVLLVFPPPPPPQHTHTHTGCPVLTNAQQDQLHKLRGEYPDYGVQRIKTLLQNRFPQYAVNERRVRKLLVQHGLSLTRY